MIFGEICEANSLAVVFSPPIYCAGWRVGLRPDTLSAESYVETAHFCPARLPLEARIYRNANAKR